MDLKLTDVLIWGNGAERTRIRRSILGSLKRKVSAFMKDLDHELWKYGIPSKTKT